MKITVWELQLATRKNEHTFFAKLFCNYGYGMYKISTNLIGSAYYRNCPNLNVYICCNIDESFSVNQTLLSNDPIWHTWKKCVHIYKERDSSINVQPTCSGALETMPNTIKKLQTKNWKCSHMQILLLLQRLVRNGEKVKMIIEKNNIKLLLYHTVIIRYKNHTFLKWIRKCYYISANLYVYNYILFLSSSDNVTILFYSWRLHV